MHVTSLCFDVCVPQYCPLIVADVDGNSLGLYSCLQSLLAKHKEFSEKLEEVCDNLTLTENQLMGHQQQAENTESVTDLQQYQKEHQVWNRFVLCLAYES